MEDNKKIKAAFNVGDMITKGGNLCRILYVGNTSYIYKHGAELLRIARKIIVDEICRDMMKYNI